MSLVESTPQWICFINGLEVPIIAASTTTQSGGLASAQVTMPYSPFISKLPKYTKITLFSYDSSEPLLEFDGVIQGISWRQDKVSGNTGLFVLAQTDGMIWSEREKFNFYIDSGFNENHLMQTTREYEERSIISRAAVSDPLAYFLNQNSNDPGEAAVVLLTHTFDMTETNYGAVDYVDCGYYLNKKAKTISESPGINPEYYADYIKKFYENFEVRRKLCRLPIPDKWKQAFKMEYNWKILTNGIQPLEGKVNFWNYLTYICDMFNFEVYDIPDACITGIEKNNMTHINNNEKANASATNLPILSEYIIKPKTPFGPIPYCNVIFPDQVLDKSFFKNYQNEITRCFTVVGTFPGNAVFKTVALNYSVYTAPFMPDDKNTYFGSFNMSKPDAGTNVFGNIAEAYTNTTEFLVRSPYETEFGVLAKQVELPAILARLLTSVPDPIPAGKTKEQALAENRTTLFNMVNAQFFTSYTEKVSFTLQVTPDVDMVPGSTVLVLDENDDHMLAYCYGREKIWDKNGQQLINLKLTYPRHYTLQSGFSNNYLNTMDPKYYKDTYSQDVGILESYIGCKTLSQAFTMDSTIYELMEKWNKLGQNTPLLKSASPYIRSRTSYTAYQAFYGVADPVAYDSSKAFNKLPSELIKKWGYTTDSVATMPALQWTYAKDGYLNRQSTATENTDSEKNKYPAYYKPSYDELNSPGPIRVSPFPEGIVNCHNRYLMQIGNNIS